MTIVSSVGQQHGSLAAAVKYGAPSASAVNLTGAASSGSTLVTVFGHGAGASGLSAKLNVGGTACAASTWQSDSNVYCRTPSALQARAGVVLTAGLQRSNATVNVSVNFDAPSVSSVGVSNVASSGSSSVTVVGVGGVGVVKDLFAAVFPLITFLG